MQKAFGEKGRAASFLSRCSRRSRLRLRRRRRRGPRRRHCPRPRPPCREAAASSSRSARAFSAAPRGATPEGAPGARAAPRRSPRDGPTAARAAVKRNLRFRRLRAPYTRGRCRSQLVRPQGAPCTPRRREARPLAAARRGTWLTPGRRSALRRKRPGPDAAARSAGTRRPPSAAVTRPGRDARGVTGGRPGGARPARRSQRVRLDRASRLRGAHGAPCGRTSCDRHRPRV